VRTLPAFDLPFEDGCVSNRLCGDVGDGAAASTVEALILVTKVLEVVGHNALLVWRTGKDVRETASGDVRSRLGIAAPRAAGSGDKGPIRYIGGVSNT